MHLVQKCLKSYWVKNKTNSLVLLYAIGITSNAFASFITIDSEIITTIEKNIITIEVNITNNGDETAYSISLDTRFQNNTYSLPPIKTLEPGEITKRIFSSSIEKKISRTIIPLIISYQNIEKQEFSIVTFANAKIVKQPELTLCGSMTPIRITQHATLTMKIKNFDDQPHSVSIKMITPREFSVAPSLQKISIPPTSEVKLHFKLENESAMPNNDYFIFGVISEEGEDNRIYENIVEGKIITVSLKNIFYFFTNKNLVPMLGFLIFAYILSQFLIKRNIKNV
ncbi:MAG: CARDB domain-containing protein [Candidatus Saelkia tenebricola]|nr:CARDB domain-containing protein [Candidatus Saelkia tenebricola]